MHTHTKQVHGCCCSTWYSF